MEYVDLEKAALRAKNVTTSEIISCICNYVGASEADVRIAIMPLVRLWDHDEKYICIWRNMTTSQFENYIVKKIAEREGGTPVFFTYHDDIFRENNSEKNVFEKNKLFYEQGKNMKTVHLCCNIKSYENKPLGKMRTQCGLTLIEYHLRMRKRVGLCSENIETIDLGKIFRNLLKLSKDRMKYSHDDGRAKKEWYYPLWMIITSKLIVIEDFDVCKGEIKQLIDYSYSIAILKGLRPNFVLLRGGKAVDWYMTQSEPKGVPNEILKATAEIK
jgi:hypothetical protein